MRMSAIIFAFVLLFSQSMFAEDWIRIVDPANARICISPTKKVVEIETWKLRGHMNFVNLSFWGNRGPVGALYIDSVSHGHGKPKWPVLCLRPYVGEYRGGAIIDGFSGSDVLVRDSKAVKQSRSFFSRRRCPRTGVGVLPDGRLIIIVTTAATLKDFSRKFIDNGATFAMNVDGGSSTMFIENGVSKWNSKRSAVPVILSW